MNSKKRKNLAKPGSYPPSIEITNQKVFYGDIKDLKRRRICGINEKTWESVTIIHIGSAFRVFSLTRQTMKLESVYSQSFLPTLLQILLNDGFELHFMTIDEARTFVAEYTDEPAPPEDPNVTHKSRTGKPKSPYGETQKTPFEIPPINPVTIPGIIERDNEHNTAASYCAAGVYRFSERVIVDSARWEHTPQDTIEVVLDSGKKGSKGTRLRIPVKYLEQAFEESHPVDFVGTKLILTVTIEKDDTEINS